MLDALRFVAAYGVVLLHYRDHLVPSGSVAYQALGTGALFVDLFFLISGFIIMSVYQNRMKTWPDFRTYLLKRIARLVPLHWLTLGFYAAIAIATAVLGVKVTDRASYDFRCFVPNALLLNSTGICDRLTFNGVSWSVSAEMVMYLACPLLLIVTGGRAVRLVGIGVLLFAALTLGGRLLSDDPWYHWSYANGWLRAGPSFIIGMGIFGIRHRLPRVPFAASLAWMALTASFVLRGIGAPELASLGAIYVVFVMAVNADERCAPGSAATIIAPLGNLTYSLYMLHPIVLTVVVTLLGRQAVQAGGAAMYVAGYTGLIAVFPIAWLSLVYFEMPLRSRLGGGSRRHPHAAASSTNLKSAG